jgi:two-component system, CitB family, sensor kinase
VTLRSDEQELCVIVRDNGPGLPADDPEKIFTPGYSTKKTQTPGGRGVGLALVRRAVTRLGGTIRVANDGGAVFHIHLPLATIPADSAIEVTA